MSMSDPIADMLTRIRNAQIREHKTVSMPHSGIKVAIAEVLQKEGYVEDYKVIPEKPQAVLQVTLKYVGDRRDRRSVITDLQRVSRPGRRVYVGMGISIVTTSKGIMTDQQARRMGIGGEVLCKVW